MSELKPGWRRVRFSEVVRQVKDRVNPETAGLERFVAGEHMETDDLKIRRWGTIGESDLGPAFHMRFRPGQVLYGSRRTYLRKVALPDFEGICANTTFVLESADPQVLLPDLLPFLMQTEAFHAHSQRESKGSVNPYVNFSDLAWYEFALPPLEVQLHAVELLTTYLETEERLRTARSQGSVLEAAMLETHFALHVQKGLTVFNRARAYSGGTPARAKAEYWRGAIPWLSPKDMKERIVSGTTEHISESALEIGQSLAPAGTTFVVVRGMILQHTFPVCRSTVPMAFNQDIKGFVPSPELVPEYLTLWFQWAAPRLLRMVSETTHGTKRLESDRFEQLPFSSASREEQLRFLRSMEAVSAALNAIDERRSTARAIRCSALESLGIT